MFIGICSQLFEPMRKKRPNFQSKVQLIIGDCLSPGLGLSNDDRNLLKQNINFIFHIAATVRFDQHIHTAFTINVMATQHLLEIASESKNLKVSFIYSAMNFAYLGCSHKTICSLLWLFCKLQ